MSLINIIFPKKCISCGDFIENAEKDVFCIICRTKYESIKREKCRVCGAPHSKCHCVVPKLQDIGLPLSQRHVFAFDGELSRSLIYRLKRKNLRELRLFLARECSEAVIEETARLPYADHVIVFPPRSRSGIRTYGFDQAQILAKEVSKITGIPILNIFRRSAGAKVQKTLSADEREKNAEKTFDISKKAELSGKCVIFIDDVVTSGSTAARLAALLKLCGAARIIVVSVAKA